MRRFGLSLLAAFFILTTAPLASAKGAKGAKGAKKAAEKTTRGPAPLAKAKEISEFKGDYKWGMTPHAVMEKLHATIEAGYKDKAEAARSDPANSDKVRRMIKADKDAVTKSLVKFDSQNAAWGTSIIDEEFIPNNSESMLFYREPKAKRYFFFSGDALYKMYVAFDKEVVAGKSFTVFGEMMQQKYGKAQAVYRDAALPGGMKEKILDAYQWRSAEGDGLRLVDRSKFYDVYCLVIFDHSVADRQAEVRRKKEASNPKGSFVDSIISDKTNDRDENDNVVDRITGKDVLKPGERRGGQQNIKVPSPTREMQTEE
jgi:hypothetical protein